MTTLLALYRRPEGGDDALATFERRYAEEHLPLVAATPELLAVRVRRVTQPLLGDREVFLTCAMEFEDRAALDRALASDEMRAASRNLREIAPGWRRSWSSRTTRTSTRPLPRPWILSRRQSRSARDRDRAVERPRVRRHGDASPAPRPHRLPGAGARRPRPGDHARGVRARHARPAEGAQRAELRSPRCARRDTRDTGSRRRCRAVVITGSGERAFAAGADIRELAPQTAASLTSGGRFASWDRIAAIGLPMIAAVRGFALGGGVSWRWRAT
jgi:uncharacterized protein (TIGR02118 family)